MAEHGVLVLLAAAIALLCGCAGPPSSAEPDYRRLAAKDPRTLAADYLQRRAGKPLLLVGAGGGSARTAVNFHYGVLKLTLGADAYAWEFLAVRGDTLSDKGSASCNRKRGT